MENINKIDLIKEIEKEFFSRINTKNSWGKNEIRIQWNESTIKVYESYIKTNEARNNTNSLLDKY